MASITPETNYNHHRWHELSLKEMPACYTNPSSIDAWRHHRMLSTIQPLFRAFPHGRWMTVGDGNYGSDAFYVQKQGFEVTATSLTDATLQQAHISGYIRLFAAENAERLSPPDESFDFVLCKESYHHFPRPPLAFYEMLWVAKLAVALIEPLEGRKRLLDILKDFAKRILRGNQSSLFEPSGNFVYRVTVRDIEKMMTALNARLVAVYRFNDFYQQQFSQAATHCVSLSWFGTRCGILAQNVLCRLRLMNYGLATIIAFKVEIPETLKADLQKSGFDLISLPQNPYM